MRILVTGGAGYIGSHVVRQLSVLGHDVVVVDDLTSGFEDALLHNETLIKGDIRDERVLDQAFGVKPVDAVMHFAASIVVSESVRDPIKYYSNNVLGIGRLLIACQKYNIKKFIFSSTAAVYGNLETGYAAEEETRKPLNPYGASKAMSERILKDCARVFGMDYAILRYFNVAGADPEGRLGQRTQNATHLIKICCEAAVGRRKIIEIYGEDYQTPDGTCIRDYVHVEDLASAHILALDSKEKELTFNVGYGRGLSVKEVIEATWRVTGSRFRVKIAKRRPGDSEILVARADRIKSLGWSPKYDSIEKIILDAYNYEKKLAATKNQD